MRRTLLFTSNGKRLDWVKHQVQRVRHTTCPRNDFNMAENDNQPPLAVPTMAPDFTLTSVHGKKISLSDYRGRQHVVLVINRGFV